MIPKSAAKIKWGLHREMWYNAHGMEFAKRIYLSPPWVDGAERRAVAAAFDSGYVAPCGPAVEELESRLAALSSRRRAVAVSSGTAALDLVCAHLGVDESWTVVSPTLTFIASAGPAYHRRARLAFVDCDATGNADPALVDAALRDAAPAAAGKLLFIAVDLYGRCNDYSALERICAKRGAKLVVDSAEAVGAKDPSGRPAGSAGIAAIYSFNGNKIVTTSGGGAVLTDDYALADHVRSMSQQSREPVPWYEHREVGYNCRMSNILAAVGLAQLSKLPDILARRAANAKRYGGIFADTRFTMLPPVPGETHWLNVALAPTEAERDALLASFAAADIEARPVWKPMHLQPVFADVPVYGGAVAEDLFRRGVCLPSGSGLDDADFARISAAIGRVR